MALMKKVQQNNWNFGENAGNQGCEKSFCGTFHEVTEAPFRFTIQNV